MAVDLSVLVCTLYSRLARFDVLFRKLEQQAHDLGETFTCEILYERDAGQISVGAKRNILTQRATGKYLCYVDDDDDIAVNYISLISKAVEPDPDVVGIVGIYYTNHLNPKRFIHSIQYHNWEERGGIYYRPPNHLNPVKSDIAKRFSFPEKYHGEDKDWCMALRDAKVLKKEEFISQPIYHYLFSPQGSATLRR